MTSQEYYDSPDEWGNYQYVALKEIINNFIMSRDPDDYMATTPRFKVLYQAMRGLREFYFDILREVRAIELELSTNLTVTLPPDFINYVRISWVDENGDLHAMAEDRSMSIAAGYLQDNEYGILFDSNGCAIEDSSAPTPVDTTNLAGLDGGAVQSYQFKSNRFQPNKDTSKSFINGRYVLDKNRGVIEFGSDAMGRNIVLEYISDGLFTGCEGRPEEDIRIHKFAESAILDYIFYELIKNRRNVPQSEKARSRKEYFNSRKNAKQRINSLRKDELLQVFKGASRWIK
jgi:hypothetical protein